MAMHPAPPVSHTCQHNPSAAIPAEGGGVGSEGADALHWSHSHTSLQRLLEVEGRGVPSLQLQELWALAHNAVISCAPAVQSLLGGIKTLEAAPAQVTQPCATAVSEGAQGAKTFRASMLMSFPPFTEAVAQHMVLSRSERGQAECSAGAETAAVWVSPSHLKAHLLAACLLQSQLKGCKQHIDWPQRHAALNQIVLQSLLEGEERAVQELRQQLQAERAQATQLTSDVQQHTDGAAVAQALAQHSLAGQASTALCAS